MHNISKTLTAAGLSLTLALCGATPVWAASPDAWITTKAKLALLTGEGPSALDVNVDTVNSRVTLHGKVTTTAQKSAAEAAVRKIDGVTDVRNLLQVVAADEQKAVDASDEQIKDHIQTALKAEAALSDSKIAVQSVNQGVVLLGGEAASLTDHLAAVEIAASAPGVRDVASEIVSPNAFADDEIWKDTKTNVAAATDQFTGSARDLWVTSAVKMMLLANSEVPALDVNVDTHRGVVTLFGIVPSPAAKASAEADVKKVAGVKSVVNDLQIVPESRQEAVAANDDETEKRLAAALDDHETLDDVDVEVKNGIARLTGSVEHGSDRLEAAVIARSTRGVRAVQDDLTLSN